MSFDLYAGVDLRELGLALPDGRQLVITEFPYETEDANEQYVLSNCSVLKTGVPVKAEKAAK